MVGGGTELRMATTVKEFEGGSGERMKGFTTAEGIWKEVSLGEEAEQTGCWK